MICSASSKRSTRWSVGQPKALYSASYQPAPNPSVSRPPLIVVRRHRHLRQQRGIPERAAHDELPKLDSRRRGGERGHDRPRLVDALRFLVSGARDHVVTGPHRVEADLFGLLDERQDLRPGGHPPGAVRLRHGQHHADPHGKAA